MAIGRERMCCTLPRSRGSRSPRGRSTPCASQLGAILEAVGKVSELDLTDVEPMTHPLDLVNEWAEDEPRPSLTQEEALANAPDAHEGSLPRAGGRRVSRDRHPEADRRGGAGLLERGEVSGDELAGAYLEAIEARDAELHAYLHVVGERGRGRPDRAQGRHHDQGHPDDGRLEDPRRLHAVVRLDGRRPLQGSRAAHHRQDEPRRVRHGLVHGELGLRADEEPVGSRARAGRLVRRLRGRGRRRARALGARHRHGRLGEAAGLALRRRRPAPDLRHGLALRDRRLRVEPRPGRAADEDRARQRAPVRADRGPRSLPTRRPSSCPEPVAIPDGDGPAPASASASPRR